MENISTKSDKIKNKYKKPLGLCDKTYCKNYR